MKKILTLGICISLLLQSISVSAEVNETVTISSSIPAAYNTAEAFLEAQGATCAVASDGCNTITIEDGKFGASTRMACQGDPIYSCTQQKEEEIRMCPMDYSPVCGIDGVTYSNSCMAGDVEIIFENECSEETSKLSDNDMSFYNTIKTKVDLDFQTRVIDVLGNYEKRMKSPIFSDNVNPKNNKERHEEIIEKVEIIIENYLSKFPQDIALPEAANDKYLKLSFIKFELIMLDI